MASVNTVLGPVEAEHLGPTMSHVHHTINIFCLYQQPEAGPLYGFSQRKLSMDMLGLARRRPFSVKDNLVQDDLDLAIREFRDYVLAGGKTVVNVDLPGIGRDAGTLQRIARATGANIIASTGWYAQVSHPPYVAGLSVEQLRGIMVREITEGIEGTGVKAGNIGEIAMSGTAEQPFQPDEEKVLRAAAQAQAITGVSLTVHPNYLGNHWDTYLDLLEQEGADLAKCYMAHCGMYTDVEVHQHLLDRGVGFLSFDQFGHEEYFEDLVGPGAGMPSDREDVKSVARLVALGRRYENRILLASEVGFKTTYKAYGGYGYSHVLDNIVPWLLRLGVTRQQIDIMLVENPRRLHSPAAVRRG